MGQVIINRISDERNDQLHHISRVICIEPPHEPPLDEIWGDQILNAGRVIRKHNETHVSVWSWCESWSEEWCDYFLTGVCGV